MTYILYLLSNKLAQVFYCYFEENYGMKALEKKEKVIMERDYNIKFSYLSSPPTFSNHWHEFVEFILATTDHNLYSIANEQFILDKGDLLLVWPGEMHSNISVSADTSLVMQFKDHYIYNHHDLTLNYPYLRNYHKIGTKEMPELNHQLTAKIREAYHIFSSSNPFAETACTIQLYSLLLVLGNHALKDAKNTQLSYDINNPNFIKIRDACAYISKNCNKNLTQKEIADIFGFSQFYFSKLFKKYMHISFNDFLSNERIRLAIKLLCEESIPITEIAYLSGFQSISNFNRVFRKTVHHSPTEYRKLYNGNVDSAID